MGNVDELQRIWGKFTVTFAKEYVPAMCNLGKLQMNLEELQMIMGESLGNLGELQRIMSITLLWLQRIMGNFIVGHEINQI